MLSKIAVTGGLSSGKSTFCRMLQEASQELDGGRNRPVVVVSADQIVHQLISQDTSLLQRIVALLGDTVLADGKIDRKKVADQVFQSKEKLTALENLLHPLVQAKIRRLYQEMLKKSPAALFVAEVPLLFETEDPALFYDATVCVSSKENDQINRSQFPNDDFYRRNARQLPLKEKEKMADFVIDNSGTLEHLKKQAQNLFQQLS